MIKKQNFVITGKLQNYTREQMKKKITDAGGIVKDAITHDVDFLIVGDTGRHGKTNKIQAAKRCNVKIMTEDSFVELEPEILKEYISGLRELSEILDVFND